MTKNEAENSPRMWQEMALIAVVTFRQFALERASSNHLWKAFQFKIKLNHKLNSAVRPKATDPKDFGTFQGQVKWKQLTKQVLLPSRVISSSCHPRSSPGMWCSCQKPPWVHRSGRGSNKFHHKWTRSQLPHSRQGGGAHKVWTWHVTDPRITPIGRQLSDVHVSGHQTEAVVDQWDAMLPARQVNPLLA